MMGCSHDKMQAKQTGIKPTQEGLNQQEGFNKTSKYVNRINTNGQMVVSSDVGMIYHTIILTHTHIFVDLAAEIVDHVLVCAGLLMLVICPLFLTEKY
jgi:hypothetical protein